MMTTCHCCIIRCKSCKVTSLSHLDGNFTLICIRTLLESFKSNHSVKEDCKIELHVIGGFLDNKLSSTTLTLQIITAFAQLCEQIGISIYLETFCCSSFNNCQIQKPSKQINSPLIFGVGIFIQTGEIFPAIFTDDARVPLISAREACSFYQHFALRNIYK